MVGFKTKSSVYYVDTVNRTICGGKLGNQKKLYHPQSRMFVGSPAIIYWDDGYGNIMLDYNGNPLGMRTGVILSYL